MQWTFNRDMEEYESERRGAFQGVIRVIGSRFHAGIRHAATMAVEEGPRFDDHAAAVAWIEAQLVERVPHVEPPSLPRPTARGTSIPVQATPQHLPCPLCHTVFLPVALIDHMITDHPEYGFRPIADGKRRQAIHFDRMIQCDICRQNLNYRRLLKHVRKVHVDFRPRDYLKSAVTCGFCQATMLRFEYHNHLWLEHLSEVVETHPVRRTERV